jgi:hypothetical protein
MRKDVPIPERMAKLERDPRGYPVPYVVLRDNSGAPHFTVNDTGKVILCLKHDLCAICGGALMRGRWFLGGPAAAFDPAGAYLDGPMHRECCDYAAQVCPYLASVRYAGRIDDAKVDYGKLPGHTVLFDPTVIPARPEVFVAAHARGQRMIGNGYLRPLRPYIDVRWWRHGREIGREEAFAAAPGLKELVEASERPTRGERP